MTKKKNDITINVCIKNVLQGSKKDFFIFKPSLFVIFVMLSNSFSSSLLGFNIITGLNHGCGYYNICSSPTTNKTWWMFSNYEIFYLNSAIILKWWVIEFFVVAWWKFIRQFFSFFIEGTEMLYFFVAIYFFLPNKMYRHFNTFYDNIFLMVLIYIFMYGSSYFMWICFSSGC